MSLNLERELANFLRRFIYSSIFLHFKRNLEKYCQWKPFFISLAFLSIFNIIIFLLSAIIFPVLFLSSFTISLIIFLIYWYCRIEKLKSIGNTKNSKYWKDSQFWLGLNGWQFEQEIADVFRKNGFKAQVTKGSGDGGVDIIMYKNNVKYIVQCKRYANHPVTPQELRALWGVKDDFSADIVVMVTTSSLTNMGKSFVSNKPNYKILTLQDIIYLSQTKISNNTKPKKSINSTNIAPYTSTNFNKVLYILLSLILIILILLVIFK